MKCGKCNREVKGTVCSYCGEVQDIPEETVVLPSRRDILKYAILFAAIAFVLGILSNYFNQVLLLGIITGVFGAWISFRFLKSAEKKWFTLVGIISLLGLFLTGISTIKYLSQELDKATAAKRYETILNIGIPSQKAISYQVDFGYNTGYKVIRYGYNLSEEEYQTILANTTWLTEKNYFLELINQEEFEGKYAIFDYQNETWGVPDDILKYHFIAVRIIQKEGNYKLEIYDVSKRQY